MSAFRVSLDDEVADLRETRVNALPSTVGERAAALRLRLDRVDEKKCDGYATTESSLSTGTPVEVKSVRVTHHDGLGRLAVHPESHAALAAADGVYAVVVYAEAEADGRRIVVLDLAVVDAEEVGRWIRSESSSYQKVRWDRLGLGGSIEVERWSA